MPSATTATPEAWSKAWLSSLDSRHRPRSVWPRIESMGFEDTTGEGRPGSVSAKLADLRPRFLGGRVELSSAELGGLERRPRRLPFIVGHATARGLPRQRWVGADRIGGVVVKALL